MWILHKNKKDWGKVEGVVKSKPSRPHEGNEFKNPNDGNKGQASNPKKYRGNNPRNNPIPDPKAET